MKIKVSILLVALMGLMLGLRAQQDAAPRIEFQETTHDFGTVDRGAPTEHTFTFTNVYSDPVKLTYVKASCGCTTPNWTREEIAPGETGEINVKYNSMRVGRFTKSITVMVDSIQKPMVLYIKGEVATPPPSDEEIYKVPQGSLSFDKVMGDVGTFDSDQSQSMEFKVKNTGPKPVAFTSMDKEDYVEVKLPGESLAPGQTGVITLTLVGESFESSQPVNTQVILHTDDYDGEIKTLNLNGRVNKVFSEEELAQMPNIQFDRTDYTGGSLIEGEKLEVTYTFSNTGGSDLIIESVKASCGCTATSPKDTVIPPGQSSEIKASFDSRGRIGKQRKSITVRSNDPDQPTIILRLEADVERDPFHMGGEGPSAAPGSGFN